MLLADPLRLFHLDHSSTAFRRSADDSSFDREGSTGLGARGARTEGTDLFLYMMTIQSFMLTSVPT